MFNETVSEIETISAEDTAFKSHLEWAGTIGDRNGISNRWNSAQERIDRARILRNHFHTLNDRNDESEDEM